MLHWRRGQCCCLRLKRTSRRLVFYTFVTGIVSLGLLLFVLSMPNPHNWLISRMATREIPTTHPFQSTKSQTNSSMRAIWKEVDLKVGMPQTGANVKNGKLPPQRVVGLEYTLNGNLIIRTKIDTEPQDFHYYDYIINEPEKCQEKSPFLILLIVSGPAQVEARQAIRQTWGNENLVPGIQVVRLFLLGINAKLTGDVAQAIMAESRQHHDIIQQEYLDTYYNLTIKTLMGMNWVATYCPHVPYVMKTDSDMFVNTEYLIHKLLKPDLPPRTNYFTGYLMRGYAPNRNKDSKWYMPQDLYPSERYPVFCSGTGYVFSGNLAEKIFKVSLSIRRLHLEDVYVGICLAKLRIDPVPPPNEFVFNHWRVSYSRCKYSHLITSHYFQPGELIKYWNDLQQNKHNACANAAN
ncbi:hypothetical protein FKM82_002302 [Ascaphus truei]